MNLQRGKRQDLFLYTYFDTWFDGGGGGNSEGYLYIS